jgi:hypothetical protein
MDEFNTLEKVENLFREKNCPGKDNIYLVLLKDLRKYSGMVSGVKYPYLGMVLNFTDEGVGYFFLNNPKFSLKILMENLVVDKNSFNFIKNEDIKSIEVKKYALLNNKKKSVAIITKDKKKHYLFGKVIDDQFPFYNENMAKLIERYGK